MYIRRISNTNQIYTHTHTHTHIHTHTIHNNKHTNTLIHMHIFIHTFKQIYNLSKQALQTHTHTNWESMRENWIQQLTTTKKDHEVLVIECSKEHTYSAEAIECMSKNKEACLNDIHHYMGKVETADKVSVCQTQYTCTLLFVVDTLKT